MKLYNCRLWSLSRLVWNFIRSPRIIFLTCQNTKNLSSKYPRRAFHTTSKMIQCVQKYCPATKSIFGRKLPSKKLKNGQILWTHWTNAFYRLNQIGKTHKKDAIYESEVCHMCRSSYWVDFEISSEKFDLDEPLVLTVTNKGFSAGTTPIGECTIVLSDSEFKPKTIKLVDVERPGLTVGAIILKRNLVRLNGPRNSENCEDKKKYRNCEKYENQVLLTTI